MARKPFGRADKPAQHDNHASSRSDRGSARRGDRAGDIAEAAMDVAAAGAGGSMLSRLPLMQMLKTALLAYVSYRGGTSLATFWNELKNGTPFDLRDKAQKAGAEGSDKAASVPDVLERNLATAAGKDALGSGKVVSDALSGRGAVDLAMNKAAHSGLAPDEVGSAPTSLVLAGNIKGQVVRLALPGRGDQTVDFPLMKATNDQSALAEFQGGYAEFAKKRGLPAELPHGASLSIGTPSSGMFGGEDKTAREYRFLGGRDFEQNALMKGSLETPGNGAWRADPGFKAAGYRFDLSAVAQSSDDVVRAASVEEQSGVSALITQRQRVDGAIEPGVSTPVSMGNRLLGHSAGSDFQNLASAVGVSGPDASLVRSHDLRSGVAGIGIEGATGAVSIQSGAVDRVAAARHSGDMSVFVSMEAGKGALGSFSANGQFVGKEGASAAFEAVGKAVKGAEASPVLAAANEAGLAGKKAVYANLQPGQEGLTTRLAYDGRVVDYHARNGSMVIIERDPSTHEPKDASIIRSQGIRVKDGKLELDAKSSGLLREHVELSSQGRSDEFGARHPAVRQQFASIGETAAKVDQSISSGKGDDKTRGAETFAAVPLDNGGASKGASLKVAGLEELNSPVAASAVVSAPKARATSMEMGG